MNLRTVQKQKKMLNQTTMIINTSQLVQVTSKMMLRMMTTSNQGNQKLQPVRRPRKHLQRRLISVLQRILQVLMLLMPTVILLISLVSHLQVKQLSPKRVQMIQMTCQEVLYQNPCLLQEVIPVVVMWICLGISHRQVNYLILFIANTYYVLTRTASTTNHNLY